MRVRFWSLIVLASLAIVSLRPIKAEDPQQADAMKKLIEEATGWYQLLPEPSSKKPMRAQTVLRWINASRGQKGEDILVLWLHEGRPQAAASIFPNRGAMCHEFASLSRGNRLVAKDREAVVWSPTEAGALFHDIPNAPPPADTAPARLLQIKTLADRFTATMTGLNADNSDREQLRLLARPVYRYDMKEAKTAHPDLVDGALLAFVQGTDPEVLLLLEAVRTEKGVRWHYAFARATAGGLEARLDGQVVWSADKSAGNHPPTSPQITLRRPMKPE